MTAHLTMCYVISRMKIGILIKTPISLNFQKLIIKFQAEAKIKITKLDLTNENYNKYLGFIRKKNVRSNITYGKIGILTDADTDG